MLAIKLQRIGKKHQPSFRLVVAERRSKLPGPPIEDLGSYNPATKMFDAKKDRISHWVKVGAQPTVSVHNLLAKHRIMSLPRRTVKIGKSKKGSEAAAAAA